MRAPEVTDRPTAERQDGQPPEPAPPPRPRAGLALLGLYVLAAAVYLVLVLRSPLPIIFPDEFRYGHLARSLADGHGFVWRSVHIGQTAALYVYFITPAWALFHSTVDAYVASKILGTLAVCAQIVPVWFLARDLLERRAALLATALSAAGTWMTVAAGIQTEALAMPLATASLCVGVLALRRPETRLSWWALALAALAGWARIQLAVLIPALLAAFVVDALRQPAGLRAARLRAYRAPLIAAGLVVIAFVVIAVQAPSLMGDYRGFFHAHPPLGRMLSRTGLQLAELVTVSGFFPALLAGGALLSRRIWRDPQAGPLLTVFWTASIALILQSGYFLTNYPQISGIQRYVAYAVPIGIVLAMVLVTRRDLLRRDTLTVAAILAIPLLHRPHIFAMGEERAAWATSHRLHQLLGLDVGPALTLAGLLTVGAVALAMRRTPDPARRAVALLAVLGVVFAVQDQAAWHQLTSTTRTFRQFFPKDLEWVDHHAGGPVALVGLTQNAPQFDAIDFFNRDITAAYASARGLAGRAVEGRTCTWAVRKDGTMVVQPQCGPTPHRFFIDDPSARITFYDEIASASEPHIGRVVAVNPKAPPRVRSAIVLPCPRMTPTFLVAQPKIIPATAPFHCHGDFAGYLWLDRAGEIVIRYQGGRTEHGVTDGTRTWTLPARRVGTVRFPVAAGQSNFDLQQDWDMNAGTPRVLSVELLSGGRAVALL